MMNPQREKGLSLNLRQFHPEDQESVRNLILEGLGQRFGFIEAKFNPDLDDLQANYIDQGATVLIVEENETIIGCGALIKENGSDEVARIVRVSVDIQHQGRSIGRMISQKLIDTAQKRNFRQILVETNSDWNSALRLYRSLGFVEYQRTYAAEFDFTEVHMAMDLSRA